MANDLDRVTRTTLKLRPDDGIDFIIPDRDKDLQYDIWATTDTIVFPGEKGRRCDTVARLTSREGKQAPWLFVIEAEDAPPALMVEKVLEYQIRLRRGVKHGPHKKDLYLVAGAVIFLSGYRKKLELKCCLPGTDIGTTCNVRPICLGRMNAKDFLGRILRGEVGRSLLPFTALMKGAQQKAVVLQFIEELKKESDPSVRNAIPALTLVYAEWKGYGALWTKQLEGFGMWKSPFLEEQRNLARAEATLKERRRERRSNLAMVLQTRFPSEITKLGKLVARAKNLDLLEQCFKLSLTATSTEEIRTLLSQAAKDNGDKNGDETDD